MGAFGSWRARRRMARKTDCGTKRPSSTGAAPSPIQSSRFASSGTACQFLTSTLGWNSCRYSGGTISNSSYRLRSPAGSSPSPRGAPLTRSRTVRFGTRIRKFADSDDPLTLRLCSVDQTTTVAITTVLPAPVASLRA